MSSEARFPPALAAQLDQSIAGHQEWLENGVKIAVKHLRNGIEPEIITATITVMLREFLHKQDNFNPDGLIFALAVAVIMLAKKELDT